MSDDKFEIRIAHAKARVEGATTSAPSYWQGEYVGESEWFTPAVYIEAARAVMGEIDLDPASHVLAQTTVRAARYFTIADDGLAQPWAGRIFLNPPFERSLLALFVTKLLKEWASGKIEQAILLTYNYTDVAWFHAAARAAGTVCLTRGRICFLTPCGDDWSPTQGQAFFYFGPDRARFERVFSAIGLIVRPGDELPPLSEEPPARRAPR